MGKAREVRAVLFDQDDTLYDHRHAMREATRELQREDARLAPVPLGVLVRLQQRLLFEVHRDLVLTGRASLDVARRIRVQRLYARLGSPLTVSEAGRIARRRNELYLRHERAMPGARELLRSLHERGPAVGVVTNNLVAEQERKLRATGLAPFVDALATPEEAGGSKPHPGIFRLALRRLQVRPCEAVMVGDSWTGDVLGARAVGIRPVWFSRGVRRSPPDPGVVSLPSFLPRERALDLLLGPPPGPGSLPPGRSTRSGAGHPRRTSPAHL